jgi:(R,R)-butanediol dehydrogenase/meso-butanediol dehydrogenase/diacetyl reductase
VQALLYDGPGRMLVREVPTPVPGPGQVLLDVSHVGICGTDLLLARGGIARVRPGLVVGHEFCGTVAGGDHDQVGLALGDPVAVEPLLSCGACDACLRGHRHVCRRLGLYGIDAPGGAAPHVAVDAHRLHRLPAGVPLASAALTEPVSVAVHMVRRAGTALGDRVLVLGGGPIGLLVGVLSRHAGAARVVVSEPRADRRALLVQAGLEVVDPVEVDVVAWAGQHLPDGFDVTCELTGVPAVAAVLPFVTRPRGTVLLGGLTDRPAEVSLSDVMLRELTVVGSRVYEHHDVRRAVELLAAGAVPVELVVSDVVPLAEAAEVFARPAGAMKTVVTTGA